MIKFETTLLRFDKQGEKTGWTYIAVPRKIAQQLKPGNKRSFRVKGNIDEYAIKTVALLPMGGGDFIMAVNATMRKVLMKRKGDKVKLALKVDETLLKISPALLACMEDDPEAFTYFNRLPGSHQQYYSKWIESAKTDATKTKRITSCINAFSRKMSFPEMIREQQKNK